MPSDHDLIGPGPNFTRPNLGRFAGPASGIPYVVSRDSGQPGPHVVISALTHGNELCGADALCRLIEADIRPGRGRLSFAFVNVMAYESFEPSHPFTSRYLDEDLNRLWGDETLNQPDRSREHARAKALHPLFASADALLDLHSTAMESPPMLLCGRTAKSRRLARALGFPSDVIADSGHASGPRLIDCGPFGRDDEAATALLIECGQHFDPAARSVALESTLRFLHAVGTLDSWPPWATPTYPASAQRLLDVTQAITIETDRFTFVRPIHSLELIPRAGTVIAHDGGAPIATTYDDCIAVMPSLSPLRGETAIRLARALPIDHDDELDAR